MSRLEEFFLKGRKDVVYVETIEIIHSHFTKPLKGKKELQKWWEKSNSLSE